LSNTRRQELIKN
jgi:hypothetical protein